VAKFKADSIVVSVASLVILVVLIWFTPLFPPARSETKAMTGESVAGIPFIDLPSIDTRPVAIEASGYQLVIPRNYLETAQIFLGKSVIGIITTYPDFGGAKQETFEQFEPRNAFYSHNTIQIGKIDSLTSAYAQRNRVSIEEAIRHRGNDIGNGLTEVTIPHPNVYVGISDPIEQSAVIYCDPPRVSPGRCATYIDIAPGLVFTYRYDRSLLLHWREVHSNIITLLTSFLRKDTK
jgi:hypothetical protein